MKAVANILLAQFSDFLSQIIEMNYFQAKASLDAEAAGRRKGEMKLLRSRSFPHCRRHDRYRQLQGDSDADPDADPHAVARFAAIIEGENRELSFEEWVELANEMRRTRWSTVTVSCSRDFPPTLEPRPEVEGSSAKFCAFFSLNSNNSFRKRSSIFAIFGVRVLKKCHLQMYRQNWRIFDKKKIICDKSENE